MATSAPPRAEYETLDRLIEQALADLRTARVTYWRARTTQNRSQADRAEEHLNSLLDYRFAAMRGAAAR
jgi:glucose-6-phosphate dehydrogenase assembly protein OpcA